MVVSSLVFLDPAVTLEGNQARLAPRPETLQGKRIGLLWNHRQGGERILELVEAELRERYELKSTMFRQKHYIGERTAQPIIEELAANCDVVITALGD
jgi:hypothetical protein